MFLCPDHYTKTAGSQPSPVINVINGLNVIVVRELEPIRAPYRSPQKIYSNLVQKSPLLRSLLLKAGRNSYIWPSAAPQHRTSSAAAIGRIPVDRYRFFNNQNLNVCFFRKRTFKLLEYGSFQGQLTANAVEKVGFTSATKFA